MQLINNVQIPPGGGGGGGAGGAAKSIMDSLTTKIKAVDLKLTTGIMESVRKGSYEKQQATVLACRMPDLHIHATVVPISSGWLPVFF